MKLLALAFLLMTVTGGPARAAGLCTSVFADGAVESLWRELNLPDDTSPRLVKKLDRLRARLEGPKVFSDAQVDALVERAFELRFGSELRWRDYLGKNAAERTREVYARELRREVLAHGLRGFLDGEGRLRAKPRLWDRYRALMSRRDVETLFSFVSLQGLSAGYPLYLPDLHRPLTRVELSTLLQHGLESPEGREFLAKAIPRQEAMRAYSLFRAQYTRVALIVVLYLVWQEVDQALDRAEEAQGEAWLASIAAAADDLLNEDEKGGFPLTREDHLLVAVTARFGERYGRAPDAAEIRELCQKIYPQRHCPARALIWLRAE